jgi:DNA topoisomerase I
VHVGRDAVAFDYVAKEGKRREITVTDRAVVATIRALAHNDSQLDALFSWQDGSTWRQLHSHDVSAYIAEHAGGHYTAKEFRTWNATVLMALLLASAEAPTSDRRAAATIRTAIRGVADWLGDTPAVTRSSYIDPRIITQYQAGLGLAGVPVQPARLPADAETELAVAALLSSVAE